MNIEFLTPFTILKCMIVSYFMPHAQAPTAEYENLLLADYRGKKHEV